MNKPQGIGISLPGFQRLTWRCLEGLYDVSRGLYSGVWLGLLSRSQVHAVVSLSYDLPNPHLFEAHNRAGLFPWEAAAIETHFERCTTIVVLGAGAGRECAALVERGHEVDGFECNEGLRKAGAAFFGAPFADRCLQPMEFDTCPSFAATYDGAIIGWGTYTLIQGRARRVRLLERLRAAVSDRGVLLLSFYVRGGSRRPFRIGASVGGFLRRALRRAPVEYGDAMSPAYSHSFNREELEGELRDGGWQPVMFDRRTYPHAVAAAAPTSPAGGVSPSRV